MDAEGRSADAEPESPGYRRGRRLWDEIHTVYYSRCVLLLYIVGLCLRVVSHCAVLLMGQSLL
jgi:hypothetical protein